MINDILKDTEDRMKSTVHHLEETFKGMRTGRASTGLVEHLHVEYYGSPTPLMQLAGISIPEPQTIMISPYDRTTIGDIERAIMTSDLGLNPNSDGAVIRLVIPPMTKERRQKLAKALGSHLEDARVAVRNIRRHSIDDGRDFLKDKMISEDENKELQDKVQKLTDHYIKQIDDLGKRKEKEILEG